MCCYFLIEYRLAPKNSGHENCAISCERNEGEGNSFHWLKTHSQIIWERFVLSQDWWNYFLLVAVCCFKATF